MVFVSSENESTIADVENIIVEIATNEIDISIEQKPECSEWQTVTPLHVEYIAENVIHYETTESEYETTDSETEDNNVMFCAICTI